MGGGNGSDYITVHPYNPNPPDLRASIGEKSQQMDIQKALEGANPFYGGGDQGNYTENCQRAVVAYELRRRGYDVVALPTYAGDTLPQNNKWRGAFQKAKTINVGASTPIQAQRNLEREMKAFGSGARAVVHIPGHVFNAENVNGKIRYVDAQTNTIYNSNNVFSRLGSQSKFVQITRTDNLRMSDRAKKSVTVSTSLVKELASKRKNKVV